MVSCVFLTFQKGGIKMERNERTLQMMKNYVRLHDEGHSLAEIAKMYSLSARTVYYVLQEIADEAGVSRESLLKAPHSKHQPIERISEPLKPIDIDMLRGRLQNALDILSEFREMVRMAIEDAEEFEKKLSMEVGDDGYFNNEGEERDGRDQERNDA